MRDGSLYYKNWQISNFKTNKKIPIRKRRSYTKIEAINLKTNKSIIFNSIA